MIHLKFNEIYKLPKKEVLRKNFYADEVHTSPDGTLDENDPSYLIDKYSTTIYAIPISHGFVRGEYYCIVFSDFGIDTEILPITSIIDTIKCLCCTGVHKCC